MTQQQINWAKTHDWFISVAFDGESVFVLDRSVDRDGKVWHETRQFRDYRSLRDWAGY
jgi:hypothetical protein